MRRPIAEQDTERALAIQGLRLSYGGPPALDGIDLDVGEGEFLALLGPSGCGKTSLLRSVAGFAHPQSGSIRLRGRDLRAVPARERRIGFVFQDYALFPHMSAAENVRFGLDCRNVPRDQARRRTQEALALVGLSGLAERRPRQMSGGQQQRVALARAIVIEPDILLLDEPLGALDKQLRSQMQVELKALQRRLGIAAVFVTHDQEEAMSMADQIVVMRAGRIEQVDAPETLFAEPRTAWLCDFMGSGSVLKGVVVPAADGGTPIEVRPGCRFAIDESATLTSRTGTIFIRSDRVRMEPAVGGTGLRIVSRRFLGAQIELSAECDGGVLRALLPIEAASSMDVGSNVTATVSPRDCRLVSDA